MNDSNHPATRAALIQDGIEVVWIEPMGPQPNSNFNHGSKYEEALVFKDCWKEAGVVALPISVKIGIPVLMKDQIDSPSIKICPSLLLVNHPNATRDQLVNPVAEALMMECADPTSSSFGKTLNTPLKGNRVFVRPDDQPCVAPLMTTMKEYASRVGAKVKELDGLDPTAREAKAKEIERGINYEDFAELYAQRRREKLTMGDMAWEDCLCPPKSELPAGISSTQDNNGGGAA